MIDNYLLEYLVQFYKLGTINRVAQRLGVTKATVSRGLSKLEQQLNIKLFDRHPQRLTLTKIGEFTALQAAQVLRVQNEFVTSVQNFANKQQSIKIGGTIPEALWLLQNNQVHINSQLKINLNLIQPSQIIETLTNHHLGLIISSNNINTTTINSTLLGTEQLFIKITKYNRLYNHSFVTFSDLAGHEFIVDGRLGEWQTIVENAAPQTKLMYQNDPHSMEMLIQYSNFPIFQTSVTNYLDKGTDQKRRLIPIKDSAATMKLYANYLKSDFQIVKPVIRQMQNQLKIIAQNNGM